MGRTLPLADGSYDFAFQSAESEIDEATDEGRKLGVRGRTRIGVTPAAANAIAWLGTLTQHSFFDMESRPPILCALLRQISSGVESDPARHFAELKRLWSANIGSEPNSPGRGAFDGLWHDRGVIALAQIVVRIFADLAGLVVLSLRLRRSFGNCRCTGSEASGRGASTPPRECHWRCSPG